MLKITYIFGPLDLNLFSRYFWASFAVKGFELSLSSLATFEKMFCEHFIDMQFMKND